MRVLSHDEARRFYDGFGAKQDDQAFYEDGAIEELIAHAELAGARSVLEVGCGTGRLAERMLSRELPAGARYLGTDISSTMIALASRRLAPFGDRAEVRRVEGPIELPVGDRSVDRVVSTYVADLLSPADTERLLAEAARALAVGGRLCLAGITPGATPLGRVVSTLWTLVHAVRPSLVGGCRPVRLAPLLGAGWSVLHARTVSAWGVSSEVLVAEPAGAAGRAGEHGESR